MAQNAKFIMFAICVASAVSLSFLVYFAWLMSPVAERHDYVPSPSPGFAAVTPVSYDGGLGWLKRHQSRDGRWSAHFWDSCCVHDDEGKPRNPYRNDIAYTSLAVLCFLGCGYVHKIPGKYKSSVADAIRWLRIQQADDGSWSHNHVEHALATLALGEAYGMTLDKTLQPALENAIIYIKGQLLPATHNGVSCQLFSTHKNGQDPDLLSSNWLVFALKALKIAALDTQGCYANFREHYPTYIKRMWQAQKRFPRFPNQVDNNSPTVQVSHCMAALTYLGSRKGDAIADTLNNHEIQALNKSAVKKELVAADELYFRAMCFFLYGAQPWKDFVKHRNTYIAPAWNTVSCNACSVDPKTMAGPLNRFEATVFMSLMSMVYYRGYIPINTGVKAKP